MQIGTLGGKMNLIKFRFCIVMLFFCFFSYISAINESSANINGINSPKILPNNPPQNLSAYDTGRKVILLWDAPTASYLQNSNNGLSLYNRHGFQNNRNLLSYNVYKNDELLATIPVGTLTYSDFNVLYGIQQYKVTALYSEGESVPSNIYEIEIGNPNLFPPTDLRLHASGSHLSLNWKEPLPYRLLYWGNGIYDSPVGADSPLQITIAVRFTPQQLITAGIAGRFIKNVRFRTGNTISTYAIKIWKGGSATLDPGTLVLTNPVENALINNWNDVALSDSIEVPDNQELWIGVEANSTSGNPVCFDGTTYVNNFGNLLFINNEWTTAFANNPLLINNWLIQAYIDMHVYPAQESTTVIAQNCTDNFPIPTLTYDNDRNPLGYNIYRNDQLITQTSIPFETTNYFDPNLQDGFYTYKVKAAYPSGESIVVKDTISIASLTIANYPWSEGFESDFPGNTWTFYDRNNDFDSWTPFESTAYAHSGIFCLTSTSNNPEIENFSPDDWLISPRLILPSIQPDQHLQLTYWVTGSHPILFNEHYALYISTNGSLPENFSTSLIEETLTSNLWTQKSIILDQYAGQTVYFGFHHFNVINQMMIRLDDIKVQFASANNDLPVIINTTRLGKNYPNPFNPETSIEFYLSNSETVKLDIYNAKGQLVKSLINSNLDAGKHNIIWDGKDNNDQNVGSGIYFYKMTAKNYSSMNKMLLVK